ncbi:MAG: hypothetical protein K2Y20_12560 [Sphingomonas sp.]|nr:hypothetical protein [Sphingomonas sp.]
MSSTLGLGFALGGSDGAPGFDFSGDGLPAGATLTRGSAGSTLGADGVLRSVAADVARFDHDPTSGAKRGILIEPAATNAISDPHGFGATSWMRDQGGGGQLPVLTSGQAAPDGSTGATRIDFARGNGFSRLIRNVPLAAAGPHCFSIWLRAVAPGPAIALRLDGADGGTLSLDTGWRRFAFGVPVGSSVDVQLILWSVIAAAPVTASVFAWGAQIEPGTAPTSFISGSRAADVLTLDWRGLGVADGSVAVRYDFDDGSSAVRATTVTGGTAPVPTDLARPWLRRARRV